MRGTNKKLNLKKCNIVGTLHEAGGFRDRALAVIDAVEVRVDSLEAPPSLEDLLRLPKPVILTVRGRQEGGTRDLPDEVRRELYLELLPAAAAVDIEAVCLKALGDVVKQAQKRGRPVIASFHDFNGIPSRAKILKSAAAAMAMGASCVKVAVQVEDARALAQLLDLADRLEKPFALMGMGRLGRVSRLACAQCNSALNYGWLGKPQVPGQWSAREMYDLLGRLSPGKSR